MKANLTAKFQIFSGEIFIIKSATHNVSKTAIFRGGNNCWDYSTIDFGILWNYFWNSWNSNGITGIPLGLLLD
jgi:hypothetical protein